MLIVTLISKDADTALRFLNHTPTACN